MFNFRVRQTSPGVIRGNKPEQTRSSIFIPSSTPATTILCELLTLEVKTRGTMYTCTKGNLASFSKSKVLLISRHLAQVVRD
jgi:hypothetical protein